MHRITESSPVDQDDMRKDEEECDSQKMKARTDWTDVDASSAGVCIVLRCMMLH